MDEERYSDAHPSDVFDWLRVVFVALARGDLSRKAAALAGFLAFSGDGSSGENCWLDEGRMMRELDCSRATLYRAFNDLREGGWIEQTAKPTYTGKSSKSTASKGRRARYRVSWPSAIVRHDPTPESCLTVTPDAETQQPVENEVVSHLDQSRVSSSTESCLTVTPDAETLPTPDGPTPDGPTPHRGSSPAQPQGTARARGPWDHFSAAQARRNAREAIKATRGVL